MVPFAERIKYYRKLFSRVFRWKNADFYFISFPKSGRTWIKVLLQKYIAISGKRKINIYFSHLGFYGGVVKKVRKGYIPIGELLHKSIEELRGKRVIFIVRDPRDVVVSHYFSITKRIKNTYSKQDIKEMDLSKFIKHPDFGIAHIISYMNTWHEARDSFKSFHIVRYEDFKKSPHKATKRVLESLSFSPISDEYIRRAVDYASFEKMKQREERGKSKDSGLQPGDVNDAESYKTRKGEVGGFKNYLSKEDILYMNSELKKLKREFGYQS